jgi:diaminohydroxyphosphoribosylaminopyrimidine deaminase/5-amino-6-(5-phosphoribosylamino)uracil reductase
VPVGHMPRSMPCSRPARGLFALPGLASMAQRVQLSINDMRAVGDDWRISATIKG